MVRLGGAASPTYISVFRGLQAHFRRYGIELDWVLYAATMPWSRPSSNARSIWRGMLLWLM